MVKVAKGRYVNEKEAERYRIIEIFDFSRIEQSFLRLCTEERRSRKYRRAYNDDFERSVT